MSDGEKDSAALLCPSAPASEGAIVLGVVRADGSVGYLRDRLTATASFVSRTRSERAPEERFRFSSPCRERACLQWADGGCSLPDRLSELVSDQEGADALPRCSIRRQCRWFHQQGAAACRICPLVVTRDGGPSGG